MITQSERFKVGDMATTTRNACSKDWDVTHPLFANRSWNEYVRILEVHDSHGLVYQCKHVIDYDQPEMYGPDGRGDAFYEHAELKRETFICSQCKRTLRREEWCDSEGDPFESDDCYQNPVWCIDCYEDDTLYPEDDS